MQHHYKYLKESPEMPFRLEVVGGKTYTFPPFKYYPLYEDLRTIQDNYRLLKRLDVLLRDPEANNLSDIELKIGLRSCVHSMVQAICRLLETPSKRSLKKTNCIYTFILKNIKCENTKQMALIRHEKLVAQSWYKSLKAVRDKRISHQEGSFDEHAVIMIGDFLSKPEVMQDLINAIKELLEFCTSATLDGGRVKYNPRSNENLPLGNENLELKLELQQQEHQSTLDNEKG